jgi:hypothetical protein
MIRMRLESTVVPVRGQAREGIEGGKDRKPGAGGPDAGSRGSGFRRAGGGRKRRTGVVRAGSPGERGGALGRRTGGDRFAGREDLRCAVSSAPPDADHRLPPLAFQALACARSAGRCTDAAASNADSLLDTGQATVFDSGEPGECPDFDFGGMGGNPRCGIVDIASPTGLNTCNSASPTHPSRGLSLNPTSARFFEGRASGCVCRRADPATSACRRRIAPSHRHPQHRALASQASPTELLEPQAFSSPPMDSPTAGVGRSIGHAREEEHPGVDAGLNAHRPPFFVRGN